jgi:hypothetical protein
LAKNCESTDAFQPWKPWQPRFPAYRLVLENEDKGMLTVNRLIEHFSPHGVPITGAEIRTLMGDERFEEALREEKVFYLIAASRSDQ